MPNLGAPEIILILVVVLLLFGAPKLPTLARSLGQSMKILKDETKGLRDGDTAEADKAEKTDKGDATEAGSSDEPRESK
jgi:sec-independent protein translocase protein TatA